MQNIKVKLNKKVDDSYNIHIGKGIINTIPETLSFENIAYSYVLITDSNVEELYGINLYNKLKSSFDKVDLISFPAGEQSKNRKIKSFIEDRMFKGGFARDSAVIAIGGGVVGDIAGFVAATYTRGIPYIQVPTSLVACVDSSIGGKTAIDTNYGKNLIGAFYQPKAVYIDIETLKTLNTKEINEGLAEVIKYGVISDNAFFNYLENNIQNVYEFDDETLFHIISTSCRIKSKVVERDEKETNLRKILNFGHTIGHAIEQISDYKITHGEAISRGMVLEGKISLKLTNWSEDSQTRLIKLFQMANLPTKLPENMDADKIIDVMKLDKKARQGKIEMSLPDSIGKMFTKDSGYGIGVSDDLVRGALKN